MSLLGALSLGGASLAAQQTGLQVTGNNIANAGTDGYSRQTVELTPGAPVQIAGGQWMGTGVNVASISRQANETINQSLRDATSSQNAAQTLDTLLSRVQTTLGALNDGDLASRMSDFFSNFTTLSSNPGDMAQRAVVVSSGASLADYLKNLKGQLSQIRSDAQGQTSALVTQANALSGTIASLNQQIAYAEGSGGTANNLRDQRDQALSQLSQIMDIRTIDNGNGMVSVMVGSMPLVTGTTSRGVSSKQVIDPSGTFSNTQITFGDNGDTMDLSGGKLGALLSARDTYLTPAVNMVDTVAAGLISAVNSIHSQGQGLNGFSSVTGTTAVLDPTATLTAGQSITGIAFPPKNGTFNLYITDNVSGNTTTKQIAVNLSGQGTQTTLNSLAASITAAGGGVVSASVNASGKLIISSNNSNVTFGFGEDSSGALASLGINTFFTGSDASNIGVNDVLTKDPSMIAAAKGDDANANAKILSAAGAASVSQLSGKSLNDYYANYMGELAAHAKNASDDVTAQNTIHDSLFAQQQAISGVSLDEEAINLTKYQRAFQGSARFITVVDELIQTVLGLIQ